VPISPYGDLGIPRPLAGGLGTAVRFATASSAALALLAPLREPRYTFLGVCSLSKGVPSTTRPSLRSVRDFTFQRSGRSKQIRREIRKLMPLRRLRRLIELERAVQLAHG